MALIKVLYSAPKAQSDDKNTIIFLKSPAVVGTLVSFKANTGASSAQSIV